MSGELCPRCCKYLLPVRHMGAISRSDNRTEVCQVCGTDEAMRNFHGLPAQPKEEWPVPLEYEDVAVVANPTAVPATPVQRGECAN